MKILISTSTFGEYDDAPIKMLEKKGCMIVLNPHKRALKEDELIGLAKGCIGIIAGTEKYTAAVFQSLPELKFISRCGAGMDSVDIEAAKLHGVSVQNTPDAPTEAVAELAVLFILAALRKIAVMDRNTRAGTWKKEMGNLLYGKTIGIIGLGRIGRRVVELLKPFKLDLLAADIKPDRQWAKKNKVALVQLDELLAKSDIVSLHLSYSDESKHIISKERIGMMKPGAILINAARGGLVDEKALYDALKSRHISCAALDVFEKEPYDGPLKELDNIIITPHIGSYAIEARVQMENEAVKNLVMMMGL